MNNGSTVQIRTGTKPNYSFACSRPPWWLRKARLMSLDSIVEGYIAVIVGSMPALAAFFRSPAVSNSSFFQYVRSHVSTHIFHTGHTNPSAKVSKTSGSSGTKRSYTRTNSDTESNAHLRDDQGLQLNDVPMSNAKAYSHANGPNRDIEEGIIKKSVAIKQSQQSL